MAFFLDWFASHNTLVIQSLAGIVALLIVFLIFRLLFASNVEAEVAKNVTYAHLEEKLNKLLEVQASMKVSVAAATDVPEGDALGDDALAALSGDPAIAAAAAAGGTATAGAAPTGGEQAAELSRLRAEISTLKDSVKRKENEIIDAKEQAQKSINTAQAAAKLNDLSGKLTEYETEIEVLKGRLSDYEIIAEDIADLQAFKKENQELKNQLANAAPAAAAVEAKIESEPEVEEEPLPAEPAQKKTEVAAAPEVIPEPEPAAAATEEIADEVPAEKLEEDLPTDFFAAANSILEESIADSEPDIESMPEASASRDLDNDEAREVSKDVKKEDRILLDEFEKHFAKDED